MNPEERRENLLSTLSNSEEPIAATTIAKKFSVSRQVIVGDIALLRAAGIKISATPRGYVLITEAENNNNLFTIACSHDEEKMTKELYAVVDNGGTVMDVTVEHPVYGEITGELHISTRYDVDMFMDKIKNNQAQPLMRLTGGIHLHTIKCNDEQSQKRIIEALKKENIILE
jgi:transcriptional regulator of NAD metabolism